MSSAPTGDRPGYLLKRAQQALNQACTDRLRPLELSMSQYAVLRALYDHPGASSAELARITFVTRQSLRDVLGGLRSAGLVTVAEQASTGRARPVALTPAGQARLDAAEELVAQVEAQMLDTLPADRRRDLAELLRICVGNLT
ncbi:MarR family transcriptional regulator [Amycolatopsis mediterranei S699]|uniref:MarR family transcriptional regulator n=2 Tax=Amycolatopsis mediterranei TaxID=33910 RepID=A0A0H3CXS7_AMYMU|nr:MarR family transcriptional regulator [Amycolatopsis mediterranei]ADJ43437.1 MarR family transcriptional regulator [Amycolatopsis mediterranei U32]AEK40140.1 MarR family transcriptional regulator [Amycolatopsis mediterranei S699]AFO75150.1 MarR family transcriptional regulator [Amycolatopsis mediterranei S699]AGT82279.1 MarR family transcriptional regulator [Amycolatopsis mediterranei RB]KDO11658.1 MarR family transcriptional regulator [Amycolatopsis mediterranei]